MCLKNIKEASVAGADEDNRDLELRPCGALEIQYFHFYSEWPREPWQGSEQKNDMISLKLKKDLC